MANNNDGQIVLGLDIPKTVSQINADIKKLQNQLEQVKATGALDTSATVKQINAQIASLQSQLKNIELKANINTGNITNQSQQVGQQIGNNIAKGVASGVNKAKSELKSFSDLTNFSELNKKIEHLQIDPSALKNYSAILDEVKEKYAEFGQVKITNEQFNNGILEKFKVNIEQVNGDLKETKSFMMALNDDKDAFVFDGIIKGSESVVQHLDKTKNAVNQTADAINALKDKAQADKIQLSFDTGSYQSKVDSLVARTNQWVDANGNARISTESLQTALNNLGTAYTNLNSSGGNTVANQQALIEAEKALDTEIKKVQSSVTSMNATMAKSSAVDALRQKYQEFYDKNTAAHQKWGKSLLSAINELAPGAEVSKQRVQELNQQLINTSNAARQAGKLGLSFFDGIKEQAKKFTQWVSVTSVVMEGIRIGKDMIQDVRELDDSLLELTKVSDLSAEGLENVTNQAYKLGERVARTGKEVIDATTEFKRAGFDMQQSMDMAESAMVMTNVAENITDTADAAGTLISVLKGFNMDASETMTIVDKINQVSNTSPIGFDNIAEGLERTAGTMAQSGNTIDQTIGLITAGYAQLRNVEKVSTGLITLSARLRGVDEEGETIDGLSAKLQEDFGKIGVAIENADGSLRSIYEIAQDYSKVLPTLSDKQKQYYAELAAGYSMINRVSSNVQKCA